MAVTIIALGCFSWSLGHPEINLVIIDSLSAVVIQELLIGEIIGVVTALDPCLFIIVPVGDCLLLVLFLHPVVDVIQELSNSKTVVFRILLDVVVTGHFDEIGLELLILAGFPESMSMANMHNFISLAVYNIHGTIEVLYPVDVWELVEPERPSQI